MDSINFNLYWKVINEVTGYDFSGHNPKLIMRRLECFVSKEKIGSADELRERLFTDRFSKENLLGNLLTNYTEFFRDPLFFQTLLKEIIPALANYSKISIWHAGCSTGEEVYSLAILLDELNLLDRCQIIATDINEQNILSASSGIFPIGKVKEASYRYFRSGGTRHISKHYTAYYDHIVFDHKLRSKIKFVNQDMIQTKPALRFHLVLCRNVFIYFNYVLQQKALTTICNSMYNYGYFAMGAQERIVNMEDYNLALINYENKIFRKVI